MNASVTAAEPSATQRWSVGRWGIVALLHIVVALIGTLSTAKGVFFPALVQEFRLSHAAGAALLSISSLVGGLFAVSAGWLMLRLVRVEWVLTTVVVLAALGYLLASTAHDYQRLVVAYVLMSGALVNQVAMAFVLTNWFAARRGLALAVTYAGTTTGGVLLTPLISEIVTHFGWRTGYQALGVTLFVLAPLVLWLVRAHPPGTGQGASFALRASVGTGGVPGLTVRDALATRSFWLILFANFIFGANTGTYFVHFIALLESSGYSASQAAFTMSELFLLAAGAKFTFGYLGDRIDIRHALAASLLLSALGWWLLLHFHASQSALYAFTAVFGLSYSGPLVLFPLLAAAVFGKLQFTAIDAAITVVGLTLGGAAGPVIAGWIFDRTGSYNALFELLAASLVAATAAILLARRRETPT
jgi:MFS family permease